MVNSLPPTDARQDALRAFLLGGANVGAAANAANLALQHALQYLNDLGLPDSEAPIRVIDSLLARALIAKGLIETAAAWWADRMPQVELADARRVLLGIVLDPPADLRTHSWDNRVGGRA